VPWLITTMGLHAAASACLDLLETLSMHPFSVEVMALMAAVPAATGMLVLLHHLTRRGSRHGSTS
jgi:hypothetical protein